MMLSLLNAALLGAAAQAGASSLHITPCELGERYQNEKVDCQVEILNSGDRPIRLDRLQAHRASDRAQPAEFVIAPHAVARVNVSVKLEKDLGVSHHYFQFNSDEPGVPKGTFAVNAFVSSVLDEPQPVLAFGVAELPTNAAIEKVMTIGSHEVPDLKMASVLEAPNFVDVTIAADGKSLKATLKPDIAWGWQQGRVRVALNGGPQPEAAIGVSVDVHGTVVPESNPFLLGTVREGEKNEFLIRLSHRDGQDFRVGKLTLTDAKGHVVADKCASGEKGCSLLRLTLEQGQPIGAIRGSIAVELPEYHQVLPISLAGLYLRATTQIKDFDKERAKQAAAQGEAISASVGDALKHISKAGSPAVVPPGNGPLLRWSAANEQGVFGYIVYRAESEKGPFLRANKTLITAMHDEASSSSNYAWRDTAATSGKTYWYYVGLVYTDGIRKDLSGPQEVKAK